MEKEKSMLERIKAKKKQERSRKILGGIPGRVFANDDDDPQKKVAEDFEFPFYDLTRRYCFDLVTTREPKISIDNVNGNLYAILVNANSKPYYSRDIIASYINLIGIGVKSADIITLDGAGKDKYGPNTMSASKKNLELAINSVRKQITDKDRLFFHVTNHGNRDADGNCSFYLYDGSISTREFGDLVLGIPANVSVFYFSQCYSGAFANAVSFRNNNAIGISNATKNNKSYRDDQGNYFSSFLIQELFARGQTVKQAFLNAAEKSRMHEDKLHMINNNTPQLYWHEADPEHISLNPAFEQTRNNGCSYWNQWGIKIRW